MRLSIVFVLAMVFFAANSHAQDDRVGTAASALQDVLLNLKQSADNLSSVNDRMTVRDNMMQQQISGMQAHLRDLQGQGDILNRSVAKLQYRNPRRAQEIQRLEQENYDLDDRIQKAEVSIKSIQRSLAAGYDEDHQLLLQLKGMGNSLSVVAPVPPSPPVDDHREKEKLRLMKMIYESQARQESLHEAIINLQQNTPLLPAADALAHQQLLKEQIKDLQGQIAAYSLEKSAADSGFSYQWDDKQLLELEGELKSLEKNYSQLKELMGEMTIKAQSTKLTVTEHVEEQKLQGNIDELKHQAIGLRADLDDLRSQMVDLDKRKSRLEDMIQHLQ